MSPAVDAALEKLLGLMTQEQLHKANDIFVKAFGERLDAGEGELVFALVAKAKRKVRKRNAAAESQIHLKI